MEEEKQVVAVIPFRTWVDAQGERQLHVALCKRIGTPRLRGSFGGPGGWLEPNEDLVTGALRELKEETGYAARERALFACGVTYGTTDDTPPILYTAFNFAVEIPDAVKLLRMEPEKHGDWEFRPLGRWMLELLVPGLRQALVALDQLYRRP